MPGPLGVREADDELVVGHREQELGQGRRPAAPRGRHAHRDRAFGLAWPAASRAAASLSRMT